jgi:hypothetical protein
MENRRYSTDIGVVSQPTDIYYGPLGILAHLIRYLPRYMYIKEGLLYPYGVDLLPIQQGRSAETHHGHYGPSVHGMETLHGSVQPNYSVRSTTHRLHYLPDSGGQQHRGR